MARDCALASRFVAYGLLSNLSGLATAAHAIQTNRATRVARLRYEPPAKKAYRFFLVVALPEPDAGLSPSTPSEPPVPKPYGPVACWGL